MLRALGAEIVRTPTEAKPDSPGKLYHCITVFPRINALPRISALSRLNAPVEIEISAPPSNKRPLPSPLLKQLS